jgi:signal transduction histidine kinase
MNTYFAPVARASEEELQQQVQNLLEAQLPTRVFDLIPNIVLMLNRQRQIVFANQAFLHLLGHEDASSILGLRPGEALNCVNLQGAEESCGSTRFCRQCGAVRAILNSQSGQKDTQECQLSRQEGSEIHSLDLLVCASPFEYNREKFTLFTITDISDEKRRQALERIFFHDVINTAGGIKGFLEAYVQDNSYLDKDDLAMVYDFSERLLDEIMAQRDLLAAENNELPVHLGEINSLAFLDKMILLYRNNPVAKNKEIVISDGAESMHIETDPVLLGRVLGNLLKNALEASKPGETIIIGCNKVENNILFWVHNFSSIPEDIQVKLFKRSFSTKGAGRGLGTYSVRLITERYLKGEVSCFSEPEKGTTFKILLPLLPPGP